MAIKKMRTIVECAKLIKELDPQTAITEWFIRSLVNEDKIMYHKTGNKVLVNYDNLLSYLNFETCEAQHA